MKCFQCFKDLGPVGEECSGCWQIFCEEHIDGDFCAECHDDFEDGEEH